ncbi:MAG: BatA domain-containing protein, partial [Chloroflexota bacterium]|nr:BatA domain-containing protein [Chloroflexota bacterium]
MSAITSIQVLAPLGMLAAISLPLIVLFHMRHQTPRSRTIPSLRFWPELRGEEVERPRWQRPPLNLLLLLQLLIAALLTFALARPVAEQALAAIGTRTAPEQRIILLDGSTSMLALDPARGATRYDLARDRALAYLDDWQPGDVVTVVRFGQRTETLPATDAGEVRQLRRRLQSEPPPGGRPDFNAVLSLTANLILPDRTTRITLLSDGGLAVDPVVAGRLGAPIALELVGGAANNVAVTSIGARPVPATADQFMVTAVVANFTAETLTVPFAVRADNVDVLLDAVTIDPDAQREVVVTLPPGASEVDVALDYGDAQPRDNRAALVLRQATLLSLDILLVTDAPGKLQRALEVLPGARVQVHPSTTPGLADLAAGFDLVVFEGVTPPVAELPSKPMLFVQPQPVDGAFTVTGAMPQPAITRVDGGDSLLVQLDLAGLTFGQTPVYTLPAGATEIVGAVDSAAEGGPSGPLLWRGQINEQPYLALAFSIAESNISGRVVFPVLVARIVEELAADPFPAAVPLGEPVVFQPAADTTAVRITRPDNHAVTLTPSDAGPVELTFSETGQEGAYAVAELRADGSVLGEGRFVVNAGHIAESDLRPNSALAAALTSAQ